MTTARIFTINAETVYSAMMLVAKACEDHARDNTSQTEVPHALWNVEALHFTAAKRFAATALGGRPVAPESIHNISCDLDEDCTCAF